MKVTELAQNIVNRCGNHIDWADEASVEGAIDRYMDWNDMYAEEWMSSLKAACRAVAPSGEVWRRLSAEEVMDSDLPRDFDFRIRATSSPSPWRKRATRDISSPSL